MIQIIKIMFYTQFLDQSIWIDEGEKTNLPKNISAKNPFYIMRYHDFNLEKSWSFNQDHAFECATRRALIGPKM